MTMNHAWIQRTTPRATSVAVRGDDGAAPTGIVAASEVVSRGIAARKTVVGRSLVEIESCESLSMTRLAEIVRCGGSKHRAAGKVDRTSPLSRTKREFLGRPDSETRSNFPQRDGFSVSLHPETRCNRIEFSK